MVLKSDLLKPSFTRCAGVGPGLVVVPRLHMGQQQPLFYLFVALELALECQCHCQAIQMVHLQLLECRFPLCACSFQHCQCCGTSGTCIALALAALVSCFFLAITLMRARIFGRQPLSTHCFETPLPLKINSLLCLLQVAILALSRP